MHDIWVTSYFVYMCIGSVLIDAGQNIATLQLPKGYYFSPTKACEAGMWPGPKDHDITIDSWP